MPTACRPVIKTQIRQYIASVTSVPRPLLNTIFMLSHTSTLDIITHDPSFRCNSCSGYELSDYERSLLGDAQLVNFSAPSHHEIYAIKQDDVSDLQAHLQFLSDAVNSNLQAAINLERLFHEVNSKMMYVAPYIRSIIQAASGPDIQ